MDGGGTTAKIDPFAFPIVVTVTETEAPLQTRLVGETVTFPITDNFNVTGLAPSAVVHVIDDVDWAATDVLVSERRKSPTNNPTGIDL